MHTSILFLYQFNIIIIFLNLIFPDSLTQQLWLSQWRDCLFIEQWKMGMCSGKLIYTFIFKASTGDASVKEGKHLTFNIHSYAAS